MLDYRINTFLTLYNEMNYRKTAEKLNMTQPGVTQHIHYLENYYKTKLFSFDGHELTRTENAEILKRHIDSMLSEEKEIFAEFSKNTKNVLNIGATKTIGEFVLVQAVRNFLKDPDNILNLVVDNTENLLIKLENAELDFAILEGIFDKSKYPNHLYKKENFLGICSKNHPFAEKKIKLQDIFMETLIVREKGSGTRRLLEQAIYEKGYSLKNFRRVISVSNFSVITDMVANDSAITFAYAPVAKSRSDLAVFDVADMKIQGEFNFVYSNKKTGKEKIDMFFGK